MNVTSIVIVGMESGPRAIAQGAARLAFPNAVVTILQDVDEALKRSPAPGLELLIINNPDKLARAKVLGATNKSGFRRWAIIVHGMGHDEEAEFVPAEEWNQRLLARVFRSTATQHSLRCENARLRGDLMTVGLRISHDLRTPLSGIVATGEVLKDVLSEEKPDAVALTQPIFDSVDDLVRSINRTSFFLKASARPSPKTPAAMGEVVGDVLQQLESRLLAKRAALTQPASWPTVQGVASWLEVIWWNLISNAIQHGGNEPRIELGWSRETNEFKFWVGDNGNAIPAEKRAGMFKPFNLLHEKTTVSGLGLSIVQRLVELQGGGCGYESKPEGGARFYFTLPDAP